MAKIPCYCWSCVSLRKEAGFSRLATGFLFFLPTNHRRKRWERGERVKLAHKVECADLMWQYRGLSYFCSPCGTSSLFAANICVKDRGNTYTYNPLSVARRSSQLSPLTWTQQFFPVLASQVVDGVLCIRFISWISYLGPVLAG